MIPAYIDVEFECLYLSSIRNSYLEISYFILMEQSI